MKTLRKSAISAAVFSLALSGGVLAAPDHEHAQGVGATGAKPDCMHGGMRHGQGHGQRLEQRLAALKTEIKLNPGQEGAWQAFEATVRQQKALHVQPQPPQADADPVEQHIARVEQRLAGMKAIAQARQNLYNVLNPDQKAAADRFFRRLHTPHS